MFSASDAGATVSNSGGALDTAELCMPAEGATEEAVGDDDIIIVESIEDRAADTELLAAGAEAAMDAKARHVKRDARNIFAGGTTLELRGSGYSTATWGGSNESRPALYLELKNPHRL